MKKIAIVALIATLTSCGSGTTETPATTDSTTVKCDSTAVCDSTKCDSTKVVADTTKK